MRKPVDPEARILIDVLLHETNRLAIHCHSLRIRTAKQWQAPYETPAIVRQAVAYLAATKDAVTP